jgi:hypothetical protein
MCLVVGTHGLAPRACTGDLWGFRPEGIRIAQERHHLPACYGIWCIAHEELVKILLAALIIPSVHAYADQGSTDLYIGFGLARLSASVLQYVPCACPATSQTIADWQ